MGGAIRGKAGRATGGGVVEDGVSGLLGCWEGAIGVVGAAGVAVGVAIVDMEATCCGVESEDDSL